MSFSNRKGRRQRGNSVIEFALGFSALWLVFSGAYQYGYSMFEYNRLLASIRTGARFASRITFDEPGNNFVDQIKNVVVYGDPSPGRDVAPLAPGLTTDHVAVSWTRDAAGVPQNVTVTLENYQLEALFQAIDIGGRQHVTVRYAGVWQSSENGSVGTPDTEEENSPSDGEPKKDK